MSPMFYAFNYYESLKRPKFYDSACKVLRRGYRASFVNKNEVLIFCTFVRDALINSMPSGYDCRVRFFQRPSVWS